MICDTGDGLLNYEVINLTPPWREPVDTLVFCHGVGTDLNVWSDWLPVLAADFRLVRFDTRGFGLSASCGSPASWTIERFADDIVAVAAAAGAQRFHLVGESFGGTASLHLAARADSPVLTLTCISTAHRGSGIELVRRWREELRLCGMQLWSDEMMERRFHSDALTAAQRKWFATKQAACKPQALLAVGELLVGTDLTNELSDITAPTLLLTPDGSPFVTVDLSNQIKQRVPSCELAVFPRARHGLVFSHATQCAAAVRAFALRGVADANR